MWRFYSIGFAFLLIFDTCGQLSFKYTALHAEPFDVSQAWIGRIFASPWLYSTILSYGGAFVTWMHLLKRAPIGPAFAVSHMQIVTVMFMSIWLFDDHLTLNRIAGAVFIIGGIIVLVIAEKCLHPSLKQSTFSFK